MKVKSKKDVKEKVSFNIRGMKKAHKRIYRSFQKYKLNTLEVYILTRTIIADMEKEAEKHDFDIAKAYLDLKQQMEEKAKKKKIAVKGI